jgi:argininosuccinate lyase
VAGNDRLAQELDWWMAGAACDLVAQGVPWRAAHEMAAAARQAIEALLRDPGTCLACHIAELIPPELIQQVKTALHEKTGGVEADPELVSEVEAIFSDTPGES